MGSFSEMESADADRSTQMGERTKTGRRWNAHLLAEGGGELERSRVDDLDKQ